MISLLPYADWLHSEYFVDLDDDIGLECNWSIKPGAPPKVQKAYKKWCKDMKRIRRLEHKMGALII
jgi:hypothetical protein